MKNFYKPYQEELEFITSKKQCDNAIDSLKDRITLLESIILTKETNESLDKITNAKENEETDVVFYTDVNVETKAIEIKSKTNVNLTLHNMVIEATKPAIDAIIVNQDATLTIDGNGTVKAANDGNGFTIITQGKLIIHNGHFISGYDENKLANACIYAKGNGQIEIYGGRFETSNGDYVLNIKDGDRATASIKVMGGEFVNFDPSNNASEGPNTNFVPEGYKVISYKENNNTIYKVVTE